MSCCSVCRIELHGYYEFCDDGSPICLGCFEEYERQVRRATGSMKPMQGDISGSIEAVASIVELEADEPPAPAPPPWILRAALFAGVIAASAIAIFLLGCGGAPPPDPAIHHATPAPHAAGHAAEPRRARVQHHSRAGDRDGDGIGDAADQCPDDPEDLDGFADQDGCPDPDNDRDGILDVDDHCPQIPEDMDGHEDADGCPESNAGDRDGDGVLDSTDRCPDDPEDFDSFQDADGCPDPDNDRDGILDVDDLCPNDPEDRDGFEDVDGCPDPDNDKDRILDVNDKCPNDPETYNGVDDTDGCPDRSR